MPLLGIKFQFEQGDVVGIHRFYISPSDFTGCIEALNEFADVSFVCLEFFQGTVLQGFRFLDGGLLIVGQPFSLAGKLVLQFSYLI